MHTVHDVAHRAPQHECHPDRPPETAALGQSARAIDERAENQKREEEQGSVISLKQPERRPGICNERQIEPGRDGPAFPQLKMVPYPGLGKPVENKDNARNRHDAAKADRIKFFL